MGVGFTGRFPKHKEALEKARRLTRAPRTIDRKEHLEQRDSVETPVGRP